VASARSAADGKHVAVGGRQVDGDDLVVRVPRGLCPTTCRAGVAKCFLDGHQQVIGEHAQKDVRLHPLLEVMENRTLGHGSSLNEKPPQPREKTVGFQTSSSLSPSVGLEQ